MKLLDQDVKAADIVKMIDARLNAVTTQYNYAVADDRKVNIQTLSETKWQLAELKMQFIELLSEQMDEQLNQETQLKEVK